LDRVRRTVAAAVIVIIAVVLFAAAPLVPYSTTFTMYSASTPPPTVVGGRSTVLYALTGLGEGPYLSAELVEQGNASALVHFEGYHVSYYEGPFSPESVLDPSDVVKVTNASIVQWAFGLLNFSVTLTNAGSLPIWNASVIIHYPSYGKNQTVGGHIMWGAPEVGCSVALDPGKSCSAVVSLPQSTSLLTDEEYLMTVEPFSPGAPPGKPGFEPPFVSVYNLQIRYPGAGLSPEWVKTFIQTVDEKRNATALTENRTLDSFAAFRYDSIRAEYQISDYNFTADYNRFFGSASPLIFEEILYPAGKDPSTYVDYLHVHAPGHWSGLMNPLYTQYGYFFGTGPSVEIGPGCSATEIPGPNINITQYVISHGCSYVIADEIWFILILGGVAQVP